LETSYIPPPRSFGSPILRFADVRLKHVEQLVQVADRQEGVPGRLFAGQEDRGSQWPLLVQPRQALVLGEELQQSFQSFDQRGIAGDPAYHFHVALQLVVAGDRHHGQGLWRGGRSGLGPLETGHAQQQGHDQGRQQGLSHRLRSFQKVS